MSELPRLVHVDLEFEIGSDPISGRLGLDRTGGREFRGWIELAAALEALLSASAVGAPRAGGYASPDGA